MTDLSPGNLSQVSIGGARLQATLAADQAALVSNDVTALQTAQAVLTAPASTPVDIDAALAAIPSMLGDPTRLKRSRDLYIRWQTDQARSLAVALADLNGMIAAAGGGS